MTSKLVLFNEALGHLGERKLSGLTEAREPRRVLDDYYDGALTHCLRRGYWNFAQRAVTMTQSATITPEFGYTYAFEKPSDWLRTYQLSANENFDPLLARFVDEASVWYADVTPLYAKYISNSVSYGLNLAAWPQDFADYVSLHLAFRACMRIAKDKDLSEILEKRSKRQCAVAGGIDAMDEPPGRPPQGSWATSRGGTYRGPRSTTLGY